MVCKRVVPPGLFVHRQGGYSCPPPSISTPQGARQNGGHSVSNPKEDPGFPDHWEALAFDTHHVEVGGNSRDTFNKGYFTLILWREFHSHPRLIGFCPLAN
jgi:hypothetical protein